MERQQLLQKIYEDMELVIQYRCSFDEMRQYLSSVAKFNDFEKMLAERYNNDEEVTIRELRDMLRDAESILNNLGIQKKKKSKKK